MKKKALLKDMLREIKKTRTRFLSITAMIMVGVFVLVGLKVTGPAMRDNATMHADRQNMYDIKVVGPVGIDDEDIRLIEGVDGIQNLYAGYSVDLNWPDEKINIKLESLSTDISVPEVIEGRLPEKTGEILIEAVNTFDHIKIGDQVEFAKEVDKFKEDDDPDSLKTYTYTVVGKAISTDYIMQGLKGVSFKSGTSIGTIGYVLEENFNDTDYSFVKLRLEEIAGKNPESSAYINHAREKKSEIKDLLAPRSAIKFQELKDKNLKKIRDGEADIKDAKDQIADAEEKFNDAEKKLADAKIKLDDGQKKIAQGKRDLAKGEADARKEMADAQAKIDDGKIQLADAKKELADHEADYNDGLKKYKDGLKKYEDGVKELDDNERKIKRGLREVENGKAQANMGLSQAQAALGQIDAGIGQIEGAISQLSAIPQGAPGYEEAQGQIAGLQGQKQALISQRAQAEAGIASASAGLSEAQQAETDLKNKLKLINEAREKLPEEKKKLDDAKKELDEGKEKLDDAKDRLAREEKKLLDGEAELKDAEAKLTREIKKGNDKIADAIIQYNEGNREYIEGKAEYDEKLADFNKKKKDALVDIADGEKKIADAKEIIRNLNEPHFAVQTRRDNDALYFMYESANNLDYVSWIFPVFFFFIAVLVSVATMTRMIEEDRIDIGTYKALGYGKMDIYQKYILYGLISSLIGGIIGASLGSTLLLKAIYKAYSASFVIKKLQITPSIGINITAIMVGVLANVLTIILVIKRTLKENAASLLRPKAPKKAKKILIEKIPFIWNRLSFLNKVTLRNVFRYKSRMFMTIFGVAGCTGLIFLGFSLKEAIGGMDKHQFEDVYTYQVTITTDKSLPKDGLDDLKKFLDSDDVEAYTKMHMDQLLLEAEEGKDQQVQLMVPENPSDFANFVHLKREIYLKKPVELNLDRPLMSRKLQNYLTDGKLTLQDSNLQDFQVAVDPEDWFDFYIGHALVMTKADYEKFFGQDFEANAYAVKLKDPKASAEAIAGLRDNTSILTITNFDDHLKIIEDWMGSIRIITVVILLCAAALAFVVLYNLTNINISERMRELSTVKVLGFNSKELTNYVYKETIMLSVLGILVGFLVGWGMLGVVSEILSPDDIQMNLLLTYKPYLFSAIITMVFVFLIRRIVVRQLREIDMVESLKSYE